MKSGCVSWRAKPRNVRILVYANSSVFFGFFVICNRKTYVGVVCFVLEEKIPKREIGKRVSVYDEKSWSKKSACVTRSTSGAEKYRFP
jgi:hypothetical protein